MRIAPHYKTWKRSINEEAEGQIIISELTDEQVESISQQLDRPSTPIDMTFAQIVIEQEKDLDVIYFSVDTEHYPELEVIEGKNITELTGNEVIVNDSLKKSGYELNDEIADEHSGKIMTISGFIKGHTYTFLPAQSPRVIQGMLGDKIASTTQYSVKLRPYKKG